MRKFDWRLTIVVLVLLIAPVLWAQQPRVAAAQLRTLELESMGSDAVYSPFGTYLAVITRSNRVRVFNPDYDELWNYRGRDNHGTGPAVAFTSDERYLIFPGYDTGSRIAVVNAETGALEATLDGHTDDVKALALSPDDRWLVSVQSGGETIIWRRDGPGYVLQQRLDREPITVLSLAFAPSSNLFAIGNNKDYVELFALDATERSFSAAGELHPNQYFGNTAYLFGLAFSPDGRLLAAGVRNEITIWELDGADLVSTEIIPDIEEGYCYALEWSPDGRVLFGGFQASRVAAWSRQENGRWGHETTFADRQDYVWDMAISPDGSHLVTVSVTTNGVAVWSLEGVGPGPLARLSALLARATGGDAPGIAQRSVLTGATAARILNSLDPGLFAPRGMFETAATYDARGEAAAGAALGAVEEELIARYGGERTADGFGISVPLGEQGTYDMDAGRYTTTLMGTRAELAIAPREAEALYLNWQSARVEAAAEPGSARANGPIFGTWELVHPVDGTRYPLSLSEDPMSGVRLEPDVVLARPLPLTPDLVLEDLRLDPIFPALYRAYERLPVGHATLRNTGDSPAEHLSLATRLARYSTEPADVAAPRALAPGDRVDIDLTLVLSEDIVTEGGEETLSIAISAAHDTEGRQIAGEATALVPVLNRNAVRWDDDRVVGAFMTTVQSPTVMGIAGKAAADTADVSAAALPRPLLIAMRVFEHLRSAGIAYRVDPASAYESLSQEAGAIDFLQFPAETLSYGAGDCDDLSVLYNSILEAAGVRTAFITTPGHIFTAFALDRTADELPGVFPDAEEFIVHDGEVWVPVETTVPDLGFREAWRAGARQWRSGVAARAAALFTTADAWRVYPPVPWEPPVAEPRAPSATDRFDAELDGYVGEAIDLIIHQRGVENQSSAREHNILGTIYARFGRLDDARVQFEQATELADYVPAIINLASVSGALGDHDEAQRLLARANDLTPNNPRILLGLAVEHLEGGQRTQARSLYDRAAALNPRLADAYPLFGTTTGNSESPTARAADANALRQFHEGAWEE